MEKLKQIFKNVKYFEAVGRRKTATCIARITFEIRKVKNLTKKLGLDENNANIYINEKNYKNYFKTIEFQKIVKAPLEAVNLENKVFVSVMCTGGGQRGQAEASRLAIARALVEYDETLKPTLKKLGYLKRDPRMVERKKWGLLKARRAPQWQKR